MNDIREISYQHIYGNLSKTTKEEVEQILDQEDEYPIFFQVCQMLKRNNLQGNSEVIHFVYEITREYGDEFGENDDTYNFEIYFKDNRVFCAEFIFEDEDYLKKLTTTIMNFYDFCYLNFNNIEIRCYDCDVIMVKEEEMGEIKNTIGWHKPCKYFSNVCDRCWRSKVISREYCKTLENFKGEECMVCALNVEELAKEGKYINLLELKCCKNKVMCSQCIKKMTKCNGCGGGSKHKDCGFCRQELKYDENFI